MEITTLALCSLSLAAHFSFDSFGSSWHLGAMDYLHVFSALFFGYMLGSIPFGFLITKATGQGDIRKIGSGNIGATNVMRTGRKELAVLTLLLDAGKAAAAALIVNHFLGSPYGLIACAAALFGHCYPVWLKFDGGKGVAAFFGGLLAVAWPVGLGAIAIWLGTFLIFKISSLAALCAAIGAPIIALILGRVDIAIMAAALAFVIFIRHRENIARLMNGTESEMSKKH